MKTREELNALKEEVEALNMKLQELTDEELAQVTGGIIKPDQTKSWFGVPNEEDGAIRGMRMFSPASEMTETTERMK